ncbi:hypothetical protein Pla52o_16610 [Novipirellula galeiformis]|uniref:Uncharacterized protein n=1 Tax=Novipirellula galeiformis TaxID=2528004 RepID=A0A5C6CL71_9BACT|nr:hypothetical protein Pla52o_16610 [Novipirellula galeiformis]
MSRLVGIGFAFFDVVASVASLFSTPGSLLILMLSVISSFALALMSATVRAVLWPSYFWGESQ